MPQYKYTYLLVCLFLMLLISPLFEDLPIARVMLTAFYSAVLISSVFAVSQKRGLFVIGIVLLLPALVGHWSVYFVEISVLDLLGRSFSALFFAFTAGTILAGVFKARKVTVDTISGAICGYVLIGLTWAFLFSVVEFLRPGSFTIERLMTHGASPSLHQQSQIFFYYSFVTLTTLGYGDVTPVTHAARSLSMIEAVVGQLYIAVLIARLVGLHIVHSNHER